MIAIVILVFVVLLLMSTPWRGLPPIGRFWALAAGLNTVVFFSMPNTAATSPWRPVVGGVLAASAGVSLGLLMLGLVLRQRQEKVTGAGAAWVAPLILGALPSVFYAFFWVVGPLY
jgi:hypothetical protein